MSKLKTTHADTTENSGGSRAQGPTHMQMDDGSERKLSRSERRMIERKDTKKKKQGV